MNGGKPKRMTLVALPRVIVCFLSGHETGAGVRADADADARIWGRPASWVGRGQGLAGRQRKGAQVSMVRKVIGVALADL